MTLLYLTGVGIPLMLAILADCLDILEVGEDERAASEQAQAS